MGSAGGKRPTTRRFTAGAFEFVVETSTDEDRRLVEALFHDLPSPDISRRELTVLALLRDRRDRGWVVSGTRVNGHPVPTLEAALIFLMADLNLSALDSEPEHLHVHAGVATRNGRAVIIAAERNTGKTTTIAHLVRRGWNFVTDETARLTPGTTEVSGFPKPLSVKPGGRVHVDHLEPFMIPPVGEGPEGFRFVPIGATGAKVVRGGTAHLVVLLRRPADGIAPFAPVSRRLHPTDAVVALMQETLDAGRFGSAALQLATLAASAHCYELTIGTPAATAEAIEALFEVDAVAPAQVRILPPSAAFRPGVVTVAIDDRAVVHDVDSGLIFALDDGATRVWQKLAGWSPDDEIDVHGPVIRPFVQQLRELGVLASA
jgi:hypothetical protein